VGPEACRSYARYFAVGEAVFRLREHSLYRVILTKRPEPKTWAVWVRPSDIPPPADPGGPAGASAGAVRAHYDVSNSFYELWLGPSMMYSSAMWEGGESRADLELAQRRKIDFSHPGCCRPDPAPGGPSTSAAAGAGISAGSPRRTG
jgi:hypothetical protein